MAIRPAAIIFVNNDLTNSVRDMLITQLHINEVVDGYVFDDRVTADSAYPSTIKANDQRLMVVRSFLELDNRALADVVIFVAHGLAAVLENNFGPKGQTHPVVNLTWGKLSIFSKT
ncbi:MAG: hypothetical protein CMB80_16430 [Flammeovirgaceae bacterium]|nr:hypothetical protein [Flammeovirgaceae bacterium]|tara:strand:+ start:144 stop:491 length:348 start_codon:yes stop_codon:yes gene_type:complete